MSIMIVVFLLLLIININGYRPIYHYNKNLLKCSSNDNIAPLQTSSNDNNDNNTLYMSSILQNILNDQETYITTNNNKITSFHLNSKRRISSPKFSFRMKSPTSVINGTLAGDYGFDPFGIADTYAYLDRMREIELKHSRLAMLAAIGWPSSEIFHNNLMKLFNLPFQMGSNGMAPTVLNGELLHGPNSIALGLFFLIISGLEYLAFNYRRQLKDSLKNKKRRLEPGDFGFDPLNLYEFKGSSPKAKKHMRLMEVNNGRIAMIAILSYTITEFITNEPVTRVTPIFFTPFWETLGISGL